jgi:hypothetical protein
MAVPPTRIPHLVATMDPATAQLNSRRLWIAWATPAMPSGGFGQWRLGGTASGLGRVLGGRGADLAMPVPAAMADAPGVRLPSCLARAGLRFWHGRDSSRDAGFRASWSVNAWAAIDICPEADWLIHCEGVEKGVL